MTGVIRIGDSEGDHRPFQGRLPSTEAMTKRIQLGRVGSGDRGRLCRWQTGRIGGAGGGGEAAGEFNGRKLAFCKFLQLFDHFFHHLVDLGHSALTILGPRCFLVIQKA